MSKSKSFSIIDFLVTIADMVTNSNGKEASPYDVNFTNHYNSLYNLEENCSGNGIKMDNITKITQDKRSKSVSVDFKNCSVNKDNAEKIKEYCDENNINCDIQRGQVKNITINKNTKGVLEERPWNKK